MIRLYVEQALRMARYDKLEDGTYYGEVPRLRGVLASGETLEACREQLAEVVEEWILVRVAKGLDVPRLGKVGVRVTCAKASGSGTALHVWVDEGQDFPDRLLQHFSRHAANAARLSRAPVEALHLIRENRALDVEARRKQHLERIPLHL